MVDGVLSDSWRARAVPLQKTILIIEDHENNREIYSTMLRHVGYACIEAADAETGIALALERLPDLILLDIGLPRMDGWAACERLKSDPATMHIPVLALTAHAFPAERERGLEVGFDEYIAKPTTPREVEKIVGRYLGPA